LSHKSGVSKINKANDGPHLIGFIIWHDKMVSGATIMSALLITGFKVRLERVLTPQADDINLVLGLGSHTLTKTFVADYIRHEKQNFVVSDYFPLCHRTIR
jgi:hypothetical protein